MDALSYSLCFDTTSLAHRDAVRGERHPPHLWLHFSEWLLFTGLVVGIVAAIYLVIICLVRRSRPSRLHVLFDALALLLAALNSFIHTADGWTAVMPYGLATSIATVIAMLLAGWFGGWRHRHD